MKFARLIPSSVTRIIFAILIVHMTIGFCVHAYWLSSFSESVLRVYFDNEGVPVLLLFSILQLVFTFKVHREFSSDQRLGAAWFYLLLASICLFVGTVFRHVLGTGTVINPLTYTSVGNEQFRGLFASIGTAIGGPIYMILLGAGLYTALRVYKHLGMAAKLKAVDLGLIGVTMAYAVIVLVGVVQAVRSNPGGITVQHALTFPGDYIVGVLLLEAVFLHRSATAMGRGYVSKVWGSFVAGIFLMAFCNLMNWLTAYGVFTWIQTSFVWYLWYPVSAAFALAPAYQWEAVRTAQTRLEKQLNELGVPAQG